MNKSIKKKVKTSSHRQIDKKKIKNKKSAEKPTEAKRTNQNQKREQT
jgi:hypothetical protein